MLPTKLKKSFANSRASVRAINLYVLADALLRSAQPPKRFSATLATELGNALRTPAPGMPVFELLQTAWRTVRAGGIPKTRFISAVETAMVQHPETLIEYIVRSERSVPHEVAALLLWTSMSANPNQAGKLRDEFAKLVADAVEEES